MKDSLKYPGFWQKKRNELRIDDDPQSDWLQMQALLDQQMPSTNANPAGGSSAVKGLSLWAKLGIVLLAAVVIYSAYYFLYSGKHKRPGSNKLKRENTLNPASNGSNILGGTASSTAYINTSDTKQTLTSQNNSKEADLVTNRRRTNGKPADVNNSPGSTAKLNAGTALPLSGVPGKIQSAANSRFANSPGNGPLHSVKSSGVAPNTKDNQSSGAHNKPNSPSGDNTVYAAADNNKSGPLSGNNGGKRSRRGLLSSSTYRYGQSINPRDRSSGDNYNDKQDSPTREKNIGKATGLNANDTNSANNGRSGYPDLIAKNHGFDLTQDNIKITAGRPLNSRNNVLQIIKPGKLGSAGSSKPKKAHANTSGLNWGILIGANSSGSFTPKRQNANFYGTLPADLYFGPFVTYNFNSKWAVSSQLRLLNPQTIVTRYTHANASKVDSGQLLSVTASRKMYSVSIPIYAVYKVTPNIGLKIGPVINIPTKQINTGSTLQPASIRTDTVYYTKLRGQLDSTNYQQKLNFGLSGGVSIRVKRFIFEATYLKSLSGYKISSGLGTYKSNNGTFQFSIGFQFK